MRAAVLSGDGLALNRHSDEGPSENRGRNPLDSGFRLDGEIVERNMGELPHALLQGKLLVLLSELGSSAGLQVVPEIQLQISPTRYRVADIAVWRSGPIGTRIPTVSPFLVVETLSAEDRMVRMQPKIQEYLGIGVEHVWLIDTYDRKALSYSKEARSGNWLMFSRP